MTHKFYFKRLFLVVGLLVVYSACNTANRDKIIPIEEVYITKKENTQKDYNKKKGIEEMADYVANLLKPIGAEKSTYEDGFLMIEHEKAMKNTSRTKSSSIIRWKERGPVNVPGRIRGIVVAPDDADKWYAGTVGGGVWLTEDAGATWENLTDFKVPSLSTSTIVISETNPRTLYVGTGEPFNNLDAIGGIGVLKTTNGGRSWDYLDNTRSFGGVGRLVLNPNDENNLIVAASNGIYVTTDGGNTWQNTYNGGNVQDLNYDPRDFNTLYAGVNSIGVIKSTDGGLTWDLILNRDDYNPNHARFELDVSPANPNRVFISVYTPSGGATTAVNTDLYITNDAGATFTLLGFDGDPAAGNLVTGQGWYDNLTMAHPFNENVFYVGGVVVYRVEIGIGGKKSKNKGTNFTFQPIAAGYNGELNDYVHVDQHLLTWIARPQEKKFKLILTNDGGVYSTDYLADPGTTFNDWSTAAIGLNCTQFYGADKRNGAEDYMAGAQDNGTWISFTDANGANDETAYQRIIGGDGFEVLWNYEDSNKFIGGSQYNGFVRYVNGQGFNARHGESGSGTSPFYSKITNSNNNPDVLFSPSISGVWRSTDFAESWSLTPIANNFSVGASSSLDVSVSTPNPDIVWAGNAMTESGSYVMHVSKDNGNSYEPTALFIDPRGTGHNYFTAGIETSPTNENRAYVLFSGQGAAKILKTEDLGQTWEDISGFSTGEDRGFPDVAIHSLVEMPFDENRLWVGTDIGVFETLDGGNNWSLLAGIPAFSVWQLKVVNDQVVMATHGRGVWTATLKELEGYEPPVYFAPPTIVNASQGAIESQNVVVTYIQENEDVEAIIVYFDGVEVDQITDNTSQGTEFIYTFDDIEEGPHTVGFQAVDNQQETSVISSKTLDIIDFEDPESLVSIDTFEVEDVYTYGGEFVINTLNETVSQPVLNNSDHPYLDESEYRTVLKHPIIVSSENADFKYEDVAITEFDPIPGRFYDFVTIEASSDLNNWVRLDIYDAERFPEWTDVFNSGPSPSINDDLFREQTINLLNFFQEGDVIAIRFRLISDPLFNSFGWAIRSINAQEEGSEEEEPITTIAPPRLYPTISRGEVFISSKTTIYNSRVEVYGLTGVLVHSEKLGTLDTSRQALLLNNLRSGIYLAKVFGDGIVTGTSRIIIR